MQAGAIIGTGAASVAGRACPACGRIAGGLVLAAMLSAAPPALAAPPATPAGTGPVHDPADLKPEAPLPADALIPGAAGMDVILCPADPPPMDATGALGGTAPSPSAPRVVRVDHPWDAQPLLTGAGPQIPVRFFKRGRTLIFDAGAEVIYIERDHRSFTYTATSKAGVTKWRGTCRVEG